MKLAEIYRDIPEASVDLPIRLPSPNAISAYLKSVEVAYEQAGLNPWEVSGDACAGLPADHEEGKFQVSATTLPRLSGVKLTHLLAKSPDASYIFEGDLDVYPFGVKFGGPDFRAVMPSRSEVVRLGLYRASWPTLTRFIMETAEAGLFEPVPSEQVLPRFNRI